MRAALIPSEGIGDALLMLAAAPLILSKGYQLTCYHDRIGSIAPWFASVQFAKKPELAKSDLIIAQNDNSPFIKDLICHNRSNVSIFYPTYTPSKHAPLDPKDKVFDPTSPMRKNIVLAAASLLDISHFTFDKITPPQPLYYRAFIKRILIHPTSHMPEKNWPRSAFMTLAKKMQYKGFFPHFVVTREERAAWEGIPFPVISPSTLADWASLVYESGYVISNDSAAGHLAAVLNIPSTIIAKDKKHMQLWRPDSENSTVVFPPVLKRLSFISPHRVLRDFTKQNG
ncbi:MAG: hypothetical protein RLZZ453_632 [Chlamydiota bacterium]|jgi:hypothetical protein